MKQRKQGKKQRRIQRYVVEVDRLPSGCKLYTLHFMGYAAAG